MRSDDHVGEGQQPGQHIVLQRQVGAVLEEQLCLFFIDVQPQVTQATVLQGVDQRRGVHQAATSGIDQHRARLHVCQGLAVDQVLALLVERAVQADDLRFGQQLRQAQVARAEGFDFWIGVRVIGQQLAAETVHDLCKGGADLSGADHADGLAHQVESGQALQPEVPFAGAVVGTGQAAVECEDQCYRMFGHGMGRIGRDAHDGQPQALCCRQVDMVVTGRAQGDQACAAGGQALQNLGVEFIIDEGADHLVAAGQGGGVEGQAGRLEMQVQGGFAGGLGEAFLVVVLAAEQQGAHGRASFSMV
ncbi:hypothetical protein D3C81_838810 [compost metagenome]